MHLAYAKPFAYAKPDPLQSMMNPLEDRQLAPQNQLYIWIEASNMRE
jgi:hypothetical protein